MDGHGHLVRKSREALVHAVVDHFKHQVMKPADVGVADVHIGSFTHGFHTGKYLNLLSRVIAIVAVNRVFWKGFF